MAAVKTFDVNELLEAILLNLPFRDMFKAKAVCKSWKELIDKSPRLRRAMFLAPSDTVIQRLDSPSYESDGPARTPIALQNKAFEPLPLFTTNNWAFDLQPTNPTSWEHHTFEYTLPHHPMIAPVNHRFVWEIDEEKILTVPSACRHMYLTQPPVTMVTFSLNGIASHSANLATVIDARGITIGLIADMVHNALQQLPPPLRKKAWSAWSPYVCVGFRMPKASEKPMTEIEN